MNYLLGFIHLGWGKHIALVDKDKKVVVLTDEELNDEIGSDANFVSNINCKLINEFYNKADYGKENTLKNIIRYRDNSNIDSNLRLGNATNIGSHLIYNKDTDAIFIVTVESNYKIHVYKTYGINKIRGLKYIEISSEGVQLVNTESATNISNLMKFSLWAGSETVEKSLGKINLTVEITYSNNESLTEEDLNKVEIIGNIEENKSEPNSKIDEAVEIKNDVNKTSENNNYKQTPKSVGDASSVSFSDDDDESDEADEVLELQYSKFDPECPKCHGTGVHLLKGFKVECECGRKIYEREQVLNKLKSESALIKIKPTTNINVVSLGLVPEEYKDVEYSSKLAIKSMERVAGGRGIVGKKRLIAAMNSIISSCKTGKKLKHSYLLGGDAGFGKKSCVYTCLKYLYQRGMRPVKYMSLTELGLIRANVVKQAQAVTSVGYYYRERDSELFNKLINDSTDTLIRALIRRTYDLTNTAIKAEGLGSEESEALTNHIFGFKDARDIRYVNGSSKEALNSINNGTSNIWGKIKDRVLDEIYSKYNLLENADTRMDTYIEEQMTKQLDTWEDISNTPILFTYFSGTLNKHFETEVLQMILKERGNKCLPTVVMIDNTIQMFRDDIGYAEDNKDMVHPSLLKTKSMYWDNMLSESSNFNIDDMDANKIDDEIENIIEYDRLIYITSFIKRDNMVKPGVNI